MVGLVDPAAVWMLFAEPRTVAAYVVGDATSAARGAEGAAAAGGCARASGDGRGGCGRAPADAVLTALDASAFLLFSLPSKLPFCPTFCRDLSPLLGD
jgi:hypothetical protein